MLVSLAIYYSRFNRRMELTVRWKGGNKLEKLKFSATQWFQLFKTADGSTLDPCAEKLLTLFISLLSEAWTDYSKTSNDKAAEGKIPKKTKKQRESAAAVHVVTAESANSKV
jgi:hypothetical protein